MHLPKKLLAAVLFLAALAPSVWLAWNWRAMPQLGYYHDDSIYWVTAKSMAQGGGYRIASLPQQPMQTKYPPLYPAFLSLVWRLNPDFPGNLPLAALFSWLLFPPYVWLAWRYFQRQQRFSDREKLLLTCLTALNPIAILLSMSLMSELLFTCLFVAALLVAERASEEHAPLWLAAAAGGLGALAYLTRSAGLCLLVAVPLVFLFERRFRQAAVFIGCMLPALASWQLWTAAHLSTGRDLVTLYYTNYLGFRLLYLPSGDLPLVMWNNLDSLLLGIAKLLTFDVNFEIVHVERLVAVISLAGVVRLARQSRHFLFPAAAAVYICMLLVWPYPPDQRFAFPLYPLLLAGLWTELRNVVLVLGQAWRKSQAADRMVAAGAGAVLAAFAIFVCFNTLHGDFVLLPDLLADYRTNLQNRQPAYDWLEKHTPSDANVYAYDDPVLFLYATRKSCSFPVLPQMIYHHDDSLVAGMLHTLPEFAHRQQLSYVLVTSSDFSRDLHGTGIKNFADALQSRVEFEPLAHNPNWAIYRVLR